MQTSPVKFLVIRFSSIGDIVLTTPVVRCLKQQVPGAEVHYCTKRAYQSIVESNPNIDKGFYLDDSLNDLIRQLRAERYDYIIDLHNNLRTSLIKLRLAVPSRSFDKLNWEKWLYVRFKINTMPPLHIVDRYMKTTESFGVVNDDKGLDFFIPYKDIVKRNGCRSFIAGVLSPTPLVVSTIPRNCRLFE
jgi:ADP-heptose:LPS heptosyltransferase